MTAATYRDVADPCWRCNSTRVELQTTPRGSVLVRCAGDRCLAGTTSAKPTAEEALLQWTVSSRRQRAKLKKKETA